jgi:hypothetical protein
MRARLVAVTTALLLVGVACAPGSPDLGYSPTGSVPIGSTRNGAVTLVPRADGGVVATGSPARPLTRITPGGAVDEAWGASLPNDCRRISRVVAWGAALLVTCSHLVSPTEGERWQIWKVAGAGQLDPSFGGGDGIVDLPATLDQVDVAPLPSGGFLALGHTRSTPQLDSVAPLEAIVFGATGTVTSSAQVDVPVQPLPDVFDGWRLGGRLVPTSSGATSVQELEATHESVQLEVGTSRVQHFGADGAAIDDPPFSGPSSGSQIGSEFFWGVAALPDGRTALAGESYLADLDNRLVVRDFFLRVLRPDGSPDPGFGAGGTVPLRAPTSVLNPRALVATNEGRHLVVGGHDSAGVAMLSRYDATTGTLDSTFADGGRAGVTISSIESFAPRAGGDQLYLGGTDGQGRPAVALVWNQVIP